MRSRQGFLWFLAAACGLLLTISCWHGTATRAADDKPDLIAPTDKAACLECHNGDVNADHLAGSAHGKLNCQDCHQGINQYPHPVKAVANKPACVKCHAKEASGLANSIHTHVSKAGMKPLNCQTCHPSTSPHEVPRLAATPAQRVEACRQCHQDKFEMLAGSVHGNKGAVNGPNCLSCHSDGPHGINKAPRAPSPQWSASCRQCHADIAQSVHASAHGQYAQQAGAKIGCFSCHGDNPHALTNPTLGRGPTKDNYCRQCHQNINGMLAGSAHGKVNDPSGKGLSCHACHGDSPHEIAPAKHLTDLQKSARCVACHEDSVKRLVKSAHGPMRLAIEGGGQLNCLTCHGNNQHTVTPPSKVPPLAKAASCMECHKKEAALLATSVHGKTAAANGKPLPTCTTCHAANPKDVTVIDKMDRAELEASCRKCHSDVVKSSKSDVHARTDQQPGDHPSCLSCHGGVAHGIQPHAKLTSKDKVAICAKCHGNAQLMSRYGITTDTVPAYQATFHGRAVLRLNRNAATCVDCHGLHGVRANADPDAPTNPRHAAAICRKCHQGNTKDFAFSYASHFRLKVERSVVTPLEKLTVNAVAGSIFAGVFGLFLLGIGRMTVVRKNPACGSRLCELVDGFCLLGMFTAGIVLLASAAMALLREPGWPLPAHAAAALMAVALFGLLVNRLLFHKAPGVK